MPVHWLRFYLIKAEFVEKSAGIGYESLLLAMWDERRDSFMWKNIKLWVAHKGELWYTKRSQMYFG